MHILKKSLAYFIIVCLRDSPIPKTTFVRGVISCSLTFSRMEIFSMSFNSHTLLATHAVFLFSSTLKYAAAATIYLETKLTN
ncbi:hypothetical protein H5410_017539 [Solanum commersonii]|uniref:Uncharacterized protein n=1 Tax=Solanum commersonii TaxID=4109 RepID=A0A9J6A090_SOLCO|nr:hypothetical protein H5410_017539 [Solanum commersonii]